MKDTSTLQSQTTPGTPKGDTTGHISLKKTSLIVLVLGALGIVYGDIGTSPLYAVNEIFYGHGQVPVTSQNVLGAIGLVIWVLTLVVTLKYVVFVLLANHEGEGGVFALLGLMSGLKKTIGIFVLTGLLVLAAGLLFGDGLITPAISILSAVEGLGVATNIFSPYIIPITIIILILLFSFQYKGTGKVGAVFGPIMVLWFITIALLGFIQIFHAPYILHALNPYYIIVLFKTVHIKGILLVLGAVVLAVTGGEALYADLGHFGLKPIRISWLYFAYPALVLNYLGQGAYLLSGNIAFHGNVFYSLVPHVFIYPMVILATIATVIASQALISGAFSLTTQAVALNFLPRFKILHTSMRQEGQIYVPAINLMLLIGSASLVLAFKSSTALASAYGLAESGVMFVTSLSMFLIAAQYWKWGWFKSGVLFGFFALVDSSFLISNSIKFFEGGYVPVIIGLSVFTIMMTWHWSKELIANAYQAYTAHRPISWLVNIKQKLIDNGGVIIDERGQFVELGRVVIFLVARTRKIEDDPMPAIVRAFMKQNGAIPKYVVLLTIHKIKSPFNTHKKYTIVNFGANLISVEAKYGFMENISLKKIINDLKQENIGFNFDRTVIEVGEEEIVYEKSLPLIMRFRIRCYWLLSRIASPTYHYFGLTSDMALSTTSITINVTKKHAAIKIPELDLGNALPDEPEGVGLYEFTKSWE